MPIAMGNQRKGLQDVFDAGIELESCFQAGTSDAEVVVDSVRTESGWKKRPNAIRLRLFQLFQLDVP